MNEVVAIVEGETEQTFVRDQIAAHLGARGIAIWAVLPGRDRRRGGVKKWAAARADIIRTLRERRFCTTMFDFYAMPMDWPGRDEASRLPWNRRAAHVEEKLLAAIAEEMGDRFQPRFFIPYVQLHEFEALLFANIDALSLVIAALRNRSAADLASQFAAILKEAGSPEAIGDGRDTCPSRRIEAIESAYRKRIHGPIVANRIGLNVLRRECLHFASWLERLEAIQSEAESNDTANS